MKSFWFMLATTLGSAAVSAAIATLFYSLEKKK